jgi:uncharacterized membrane protein YcaP (DUF421 family)
VPASSRCHAHHRTGTPGRTLAQLSAFDFAVAVAIGAIIGRGATASDTSFATSAVALVTFLVAHRAVAIGRRHSLVVA